MMPIKLAFLTSAQTWMLVAEQLLFYPVLRLTSIRRCLVEEGIHKGATTSLTL
jgi:hypothetical protein